MAAQADLCTGLTLPGPASCIASCKFFFCNWPMCGSYRGNFYHLHTFNYHLHLRFILSVRYWPSCFITVVIFVLHVRLNVALKPMSWPKLQFVTTVKSQVSNHLYCLLINNVCNLQSLFIHFDLLLNLSYFFGVAVHHQHVCAWTYRYWTHKMLHVCSYRNGDIEQFFCNT